MEIDRHETQNLNSALQSTESQDHNLLQVLEAKFLEKVDDIVETICKREGISTENMSFPDLQDDVDVHVSQIMRARPENAKNVQIVKQKAGWYLFQKNVNFQGVF